MDPPLRHVSFHSSLHQQKKKKKKKMEGENKNTWHLRHERALATKAGGWTRGSGFFSSLMREGMCLVIGLSFVKKLQ